MTCTKQIAVPGLVRIKSGALSRLGVYLRRGGHIQVQVLVSQGLPAGLNHHR